MHTVSKDTNYEHIKLNSQTIQLCRF